MFQFHIGTTPLFPNQQSSVSPNPKKTTFLRWMQPSVLERCWRLSHVSLGWSTKKSKQGRVLRWKHWDELLFEICHENLGISSQWGSQGQKLVKDGGLTNEEVLMILGFKSWACQRFTDHVFALPPFASDRSTCLGESAWNKCCKAKHVSWYNTCIPWQSWPKCCPCWIFSIFLSFIHLFRRSQRGCLLLYLALAPRRTRKSKNTRHVSVDRNQEAGCFEDLWWWPKVVGTGDTNIHCSMWKL